MKIVSISLILFSAIICSSVVNGTDKCAHQVAKAIQAWAPKNTKKITFKGFDGPAFKALGKTLKVDGELPLEINGINSTITADTISVWLDIHLKKFNLKPPTLGGGSLPIGGVLEAVTSVARLELETKYKATYVVHIKDMRVTMNDDGVISKAQLKVSELPVDLPLGQLQRPLSKGLSEATTASNVYLEKEDLPACFGNKLEVPAPGIPAVTAPVAVPGTPVR